MSKELTAVKKILETLKPELSHRYAVNSIGLFGSIVRDDYTSESDIDIIVTFNRAVGVEFIDLADELETKLNRRVDLVSKNGIKEKYFRIIEPEIVMSDRHPKFLLQDILESAGKILSYTENLTYDEFIADSKTIDAVIRNFEIIGEASNRLPEEFKNKNNTIDWFRVKGFRNRIVHQYFGIDYEIVWKLKDTHLKVLISEIENILNKNNF